LNKGINPTNIGTVPKGEKMKQQKIIKLLIVLLIFTTSLAKANSNSNSNIKCFVSFDEISESSLSQKQRFLFSKTLRKSGYELISNNSTNPKSQYLITLNSDAQFFSNRNGFVTDFTVKGSISVEAKLKNQPNPFFYKDETLIFRGFFRTRKGLLARMAESGTNFIVNSLEEIPICPLH